MKPQLRLKTLAAAIACGALLLSQTAAAKPASLDDQLTQATSSYLDKPSAKKMQRIQTLLAKGARPHHAQTGEGDAGLSALPFAIAAPSPELVRRWTSTIRADCR